MRAQATHQAVGHQSCPRVCEQEPPGLRGEASLPTARPEARRRGRATPQRRSPRPTTACKPSATNSSPSNSARPGGRAPAPPLPSGAGRACAGGRADVAGQRQPALIWHQMLERLSCSSATTRGPSKPRGKRKRTGLWEHQQLLWFLRCPGPLPGISVAEEEEGPRGREGCLPGLHIACGRRTGRLEEKRERAQHLAATPPTSPNPQPLQRLDGEVPATGQRGLVVGATCARTPHSCAVAMVRWAVRRGHIPGAPRGSGEPEQQETLMFTCKSQLLQREEET